MRFVKIPNPEDCPWRREVMSRSGAVIGKCAELDTPPWADCPSRVVFPIHGCKLELEQDVYPVWELPSVPEGWFDLYIRELVSARWKMFRESDQSHPYTYITGYVSMLHTIIHELSQNGNPSRIRFILINHSNTLYHRKMMCKGAGDYEVISGEIAAIEFCHNCMIRVKHEGVFIM